MRQEQNDIKK